MQWRPEQAASLYLQVALPSLYMGSLCYYNSKQAHIFIRRPFCHIQLLVVSYKSAFAYPAYLSTEIHIHKHKSPTFPQYRRVSIACCASLFMRRRSCRLPSDAVVASAEWRTIAGMVARQSGALAAPTRATLKRGKIRTPVALLENIHASLPRWASMDCSNRQRMFTLVKWFTTLICRILFSRGFHEQKTLNLIHNWRAFFCLYWLNWAGNNLKGYLASGRALFDSLDWDLPLCPRAPQLGTYAASNWNVPAGIFYFNSFSQSLLVTLTNYFKFILKENCIFNLFGLEWKPLKLKEE